jgi:radical SAM superfamily enzyme YgiQ (UPF0313 family)
MTEEQFLGEIQKEKPDVIGLSCTSYSFLTSIELLRKLKEVLHDVVIVLGGIHVTFFAEKIVENYPFVNFVVKGEGEITFSKLIENLNNRNELRRISGVTFIDNGRIISNREELISDLNSLPFPDRKLVENNDYAHYWFGFRLTLGRFTTILSSRGCPYKCSFCCCSPLFKRKWRARSAENVLDELEEIYSQGYRSCIFVDDNFTLIPERVIEICRGIVKRKIKMDMHCEGRVGKVSLEVLKEMKNAGFSTIYFGIESGTQKVLDYYEKDITIKQIKDSVRMAKKAGLNVIGSFIIGAPIETRQDVLQTLELAKELRIIIQLNQLGIVPGAKLWTNLEESGSIKNDDWKQAHNATEYYDNFSEKDLSDLANLGYNFQIKMFATPKAIMDIITFLSGNNMKTLLWNIFRNPVSIIRLLAKLKKGGFRPFS